MKTLNATDTKTASASCWIVRRLGLWLFKETGAINRLFSLPRSISSLDQSEFTGPLLETWLREKVEKDQPYV